MDHVLTALEARAIGALIEKSITTPDQYPLSLNALTLACNQKSNRDPVLQLSESEVQETLDGLTRKHLVIEKGGFGSRVSKYAHRFCNTEFGQLRLTEQELGVVCVLLLRGPQTPGELRTRSQRLCRFSDVGETEQVLEELAERSDGPLVIRMAREPGKRESRYAHLFCGPVDPGCEPTERLHATPDARGRLDALELEVASLRSEIDELRQLLDELTR